MTRLDSQSSVSDVRFSPHYYGLKFASCSYNGYVRVYEAKDIMRLNDWTLTHEFQILRGASCVCWSQSSLFPLLLAVGSDDSTPTAKHIGVYQFHASVNIRIIHRQRLPCKISYICIIMYLYISVESLFK